MVNDSVNDKSALEQHTFVQQLRNLATNPLIESHKIRRAVAARLHVGIQLAIEAGIGTVLAAGMVRFGGRRKGVEEDGSAQLGG